MVTQVAATLFLAYRWVTWKARTGIVEGPKLQKVLSPMGFHTGVAQTHIKQINKKGTQGHINLPRQTQTLEHMKDMKV